MQNHSILRGCAVSESLLDYYVGPHFLYLVYFIGNTESNVFFPHENIV